MKVAELLNHIDGIFKIYVTEKDKKTEVAQLQFCLQLQ